MNYKMQHIFLIYIKNLRDIDYMFWNINDIKCILSKKSFKVYFKYFYTSKKFNNRAYNEMGKRV